MQSFVKDKTPEWAEKITSVPAETTRRIAKELAATKPTLVDVWSGPGHQHKCYGWRKGDSDAARTLRTVRQARHNGEQGGQGRQAQGIQHRQT